MDLSNSPLDRTVIDEGNCNVNAVYFEAIGLWQFVVWYRTTPWVVFNFFVGCVFLVNITIQLANTLTTGYDFSLMTEKLSVNLTVMESVIKIMYYCVMRSKLNSLSSCFRNDLLSCRHHDKETTDRVMSSAYRIVNGVTKSFIIMIFSTVGVWNATPFIRCLFTGNCNKWNIMPSWYPEALDEQPLFIYVFEFFIMVYCAALLYNVNCFFAALALSLSSQFELLSKCFETIEENAGKRGGPKEHNMNVLLRDCLVDHQKLLKLSKVMEDLYNRMFLFQMLASTITICLVLVQINAHTSSSELPAASTFKFLTYLTFGSMELLIYSWGGQILYNQTEEVHLSLYKSGWHEADQEFRTNIGIAMIRTMSPEYLTAGKFYRVDLSSFAQIIKASYSYFTFLHGSETSSH